MKHCCLLTASSLISSSHNLLGNANLDKYYTIFTDRMMNELTRDAALKGLTLISQNSQHPSANPPVIPISQPQNFLHAFFELLKKSQRTLHLNTLECLEALTQRYQPQLSAHVQGILQEICPLVDEVDLQKSNLVLKIGTNLIQANKEKSFH